jgi:hypothetical protein
VPSADACQSIQDFLHIEIAFWVAQSRGIGMGKLVHQDKLRTALKHAIHIQLRQFHA